MAAILHRRWPEERVNVRLVALLPFWEFFSCSHYGNMVLSPSMRIIARKTLKNFWAHYLDAEQPLKAWFKRVAEADWKAPQDVKVLYRNATILQDGRVVFNIAGNKYRLIAWINYSYRTLYVRFIGTHKQYDTTDAQTI